VANLQKLNTELAWAKSESERAQLMARPNGAVVESADEMSAQALIARGAQVQTQSLESTTRSKKKIEEAKVIGMETSTKLKAGTEQLRNIDDDIMKVESNLMRADLLIRAFLRRMATDKFIMVFMFLIVVGILTIIIYKAVNPKKAEEAGFNVPDEITPPVNYQ
jgi:SNARE protein